MYCANCGKTIPDGAKFCAYCGKSINSSAQETTDQFSWEYCEIRWNYKQKIFTISAQFWAEAIGKNGVYNAGESPKYDITDYRPGGNALFKNENVKASTAFNTLVNQLISDGWEPTETMGGAWSKKFRRKIKK
jgi:zinc-ribbon domain